MRFLLTVVSYIYTVFVAKSISVPGLGGGRETPVIAKAPQEIPGNHSECPVAGSLHIPFKIFHEIHQANLIGKIERNNAVTALFFGYQQVTYFDIYPIWLEKWVFRHLVVVVGLLQDQTLKSPNMGAEDLSSSFFLK